MSWPTILAYTLFGVTSIALLASVRTLGDFFLSDDVPGPRTRRRMLRRMGVTVGWWQISTGLCLVALGSNWSGVIALFGMGGMFLLGAHLARRTGIPPWWAPE